MRFINEGAYCIILRRLNFLELIILAPDITSCESSFFELWKYTPEYFSFINLLSAFVLILFLAPYIIIRQLPFSELSILASDIISRECILIKEPHYL